ncbi:hypothetical protein DFP73DRAFT_533902 [Morchella snyderi]|nr:hypothetical protein DFP73DRAFT_533902 [Morchella snyderi]
MYIFFFFISLFCVCVLCVCVLFVCLFVSAIDSFSFLFSGLFSFIYIKNEMAFLEVCFFVFCFLFSVFCFCV